MQNQDIFRKQADTIQSMLYANGCTLPRGKVLDILGRLCGDKDWNTLSARLKATAPGTQLPRFHKELEDIRDTLESAKQSLEDASSVVDAGEDEDSAYEKEIAAVEVAIDRINGLLSGARPVKLEGVTAVMFRGSGDGCGPRVYLLPAGADVEKFKAGLTAWVHARRAECDAASNSEELDDKSEDEAYAKWTDAGADKEALRLGALCPVTTWTDICWDV